MTNKLHALIQRDPSLGGFNLIAKAPEHYLNRVFQYLTPMEQGRFAQTCHWSAERFSPLRLMLSEDVNSSKRWMDIIVDKLGHPLNTPAQQAGAALYISAVKGDKMFVMKLLNTRPDIRPSDKEKALAMAAFLGHQNVMREILIHRYPEFAQCKNIHEIMDGIFPPQRKTATLSARPEVAPIYEELKKITKIEPEEKERLYLQMDPNWHYLRFYMGKHYVSDKWNLNDLLNTLPQMNPLFAIVWERVNRNQRIDVREVRQGDAVKEGGSNVHNKGDYACYNSILHRIEIDPDASPNRKVELMFFEIMNALQREIVDKISDLAERGKLSREELASLIELMEFRSIECMTKMLNFLQQRRRLSLSFPQLWRHVNRLCPGKVAHADHYRNGWDDKCFGRYLLAHPGIIFPEASKTPSSLLFQAAAEGDVAEVSDLLHKFPDLDEWESVGVALSTAAAKGHFEVVDLMLRMWKDLSAASVGIALCNAATYGHCKIVDLLLRERPDISSTDKNFALRKAARQEASSDGNEPA